MSSLIPMGISLLFQMLSGYLIQKTLKKTIPNGGFFTVALIGGYFISFSTSIAFGGILISIFTICLSIISKISKNPDYETQIFQKLFLKPDMQSRWFDFGIIGSVLLVILRKADKCVLQ